MIPFDSPDPIPKTVLRSIWSLKVLKAGLGVMNEEQVRFWFHCNPHILNEFSIMNRELEQKINELQQRAINGLKAASRQMIVDPNFNPQMIVDPNFNPKMIVDPNFNPKRKRIDF